jgi:hypothetical protein
MKNPRIMAGVFLALNVALLVAYGKDGRYSSTAVT